MEKYTIKNHHFSL
ncbi:hypothetical protein CP8484711_2904, partial [Chlamydia psittaci 84-8471/1]